MKVIQSKGRSPGKLIFAGLLLFLAMAFTVSQVNAFNYPYTSGGSKGSGGSNGSFEPKGNTTHLRSLKDQSVTTDPPGAVPEPATLLLLAGGLGMTIWNRRRNRA